jgi:hypothetical protein
MSTKIYNGYISNLPLEKLLQEFIKVKHDFENKIDELFLKSLIEHTVLNVLDNKHYKLEKSEFPKEVITQYNLCEEEVNKSKEYQKISLGSVFLDLSTSCSVFPLKGKTLILFYCDNNEITESWENLPFIEDYHYQDQTDKPDDILKTHWDKREKNWNTVLGGNGWGKPVDNGYSFTFHGKELPSKFTVFDKHKRLLNLFIPDDITRKKEILINELIKENNIDDFPKMWNFQTKFKENYEKGFYNARLDIIKLIDYKFLKL